MHAAVPLLTIRQPSCWKTHARTRLAQQQFRPARRTQRLAHPILPLKFEKGGGTGEGPLWGRRAFPRRNPYIRKDASRLSHPCTGPGRLARPILPLKFEKGGRYGGEAPFGESALFPAGTRISARTPQGSLGPRTGPGRLARPILPLKFEKGGGTGEGPLLQKARFPRRNPYFRKGAPKALSPVYRTRPLGTSYPPPKV